MSAVIPQCPDYLFSKFGAAGADRVSGAGDVGFSVFNAIAELHVVCFCAAAFPRGDLNDAVVVERAVGSADTRESVMFNLLFGAGTPSPAASVSAGSGPR